MKRKYQSHVHQLNSILIYQVVVMLGNQKCASLAEFYMNPSSCVKYEELLDLSIYLSVCLSVCLSLSIYLSVCLSVCLSVFIYLSVCLSICLSVYQLSVCLSYLSICLSVFLSVCLSIYLCLSGYLSVRLSVSAVCEFTVLTNRLLLAWFVIHRYIIYNN